MIKVVVFDLWETLVYKRYKKGGIRWMWKETGKGISYRRFLKTFEKNFQLSKKFSFEKSFKGFFKELKIPYDDNLIKKFIEQRKKYELSYVFYKDLFPLLTKLKKKGYKIGVLSNTDPFIGENVKKAQLSKYVDKFFFSYEIGSIKPDLKNFRVVLKYFKAKPSEAIMIGNTYLDDVVPARKLGMKAIHFKDVKQTKKKLRNMNVL